MTSSEVEFVVGDATVTRIEEMLTPGFAPAFLFPDFDARLLEEEPQLASANFRDAASGKLMSSMHTWLVRLGRDVIVIDTGCGNHKVRSNAAFKRFDRLNLPYLDRLAAAGVAPADVTLVINTHLHIDHVGWNTQLKDGAWVPTFPNARYVWGRVETEHWVLSDRGLKAQPEAAETLADSVNPIWERRLVDLIEDGGQVRPGLSMHMAAGHTAGQMQVRLRSRGETAIFTADVLHQPMQVYRPAWNSRFCELQEVAVTTRHALLADAAKSNAIICPAHFGAPHAGRIAKAPTQSGYRFIPLGAS